MDAIKRKITEVYHDKDCVDHIDKEKNDDQLFINKGKKNKSYRCHGKVGHVEKTYWKKDNDLEENLKKLEGEVLSN
jgi:hypothetical protein